MDKPLLNSTALDRYHAAYSKLEHLSYAIAQDERLAVHMETVYNLLNIWSPYKPINRHSPPTIVTERLIGMELVTYFLEQLVAANPLLLPDGYQITNEDNYLGLISAEKYGIIRMRDDSNAPLLPVDTTVFYSMLKRKEWKQFRGIVSVSLYSDFDAWTVGQITNVTEKSFVLVRQNPAYADLTIQWSDVVRITACHFRIGDKIELNHEQSH